VQRYAQATVSLIQVGVNALQVGLAVIVKCPVNCAVLFTAHNMVSVSMDNASVMKDSPESTVFTV